MSHHRPYRAWHSPHRRTRGDHGRCARYWGETVKRIGKGRASAMVYNHAASRRRRTVGRVAPAAGRGHHAHPRYSSPAGPGAAPARRGVRAGCSGWPLRRRPAPRRAGRPPHWSTACPRATVHRGRAGHTATGATSARRSGSGQPPRPPPHPTPRGPRRRVPPDRHRRSRRRAAHPGGRPRLATRYRPARGTGSST